MGIASLAAVTVAALAALAMVPQGLYLPCPYFARVVDVPNNKVPAASALEGPYAANSLLAGAAKLWQGAEAPETVAVLGDGRAFIPVEGGGILASSVAESGRLSQLAHTGGRPLGIVMHPDGYLVVCDALKGLLAVDLPSGTVRLLSNRVTTGNLSRADAEITLADDVVVASDGRVYFTDATALAPPRLADRSFDVLMASKYSLLEGNPSGRLLVFDPRDKSTSVLADGIFFANGVTMAQDESFLVVAETFGTRLLRHWLKGDKQGTTEVFVEGLPGFVDGVSTASDGNSFWAAIVSLPPLPFSALRPRWVRWLVARLPPALQPNVVRYGLVVEVAANGTILRSLHDPTGKTCNTITSVTSVGSMLYLGSLHTSWVCAVDLQNL